nr:hypothetical protein [Tanacetum cinerariifolium]
NLQEQQLRLNQQMFKEQKPNNSKLYSKGADKRSTSLNNVVSDVDEETETGKGGDEVRESEGESDKEETRLEEEESFDPIPRTPEESEEERNVEEDQDLRLRNKSIRRSDEQRNLYNALIEAYDADKAILDTYGDSTILKRRR